MNIHDALVYIAKMIYRYNNCKIFHFYTHTHTQSHKQMLPKTPRTIFTTAKIISLNMNGCVMQMRNMASEIYFFFRGSNMTFIPLNKHALQNSNHTFLNSQLIFEI